MRCRPGFAGGSARYRAREKKDFVKDQQEAELPYETRKATEEVCGGGNHQEPGVGSGKYKIPIRDPTPGHVQLHFM